MTASDIKRLNKKYQDVDLVQNPSCLSRKTR